MAILPQSLWVHSASSWVYLSSKERQAILLVLAFCSRRGSMPTHPLRLGSFDSSSASWCSLRLCLFLTLISISGATPTATILGNGCSIACSSTSGSSTFCKSSCFASTFLELETRGEYNGKQGRVRFLAEKATGGALPNDLTEPSGGLHPNPRPFAAGRCSDASAQVYEAGDRPNGSTWIRWQLIGTQ